MRRYRLPALSALIAMLFAGFGLLSIEPIPSYAQDILSSIPDLSGTNIYFSEANNEFSQFERSDEGVSRFAGLLRLAGANLFVLEWRKGIPNDADLIILPGPERDLSSEDVARLWAYMQRGGRVLLLLDAVDSRDNQSRALRNDRGFFELTWSELGLRAREDVIVTPGELVEVNVTRLNNQGLIEFFFAGETPVLDTAFTTSTVNDSHPITANLVETLAETNDESPNLSSLYFNQTRSIEIDASLDLGSVTPLVFTDNAEQYGETEFDIYLENSVSEYNIGEDSQVGDLIIGAAYENAEVGTRLALFASADAMRNGAGFQVSPSYSGSFVFPNNVQLMLNTVAWLLERDVVELDLPTPVATGTATITPTPIATVTPTPNPFLALTPQGDDAAPESVEAEPTATDEAEAADEAEATDEPAAEATQEPAEATAEVTEESA